MSQKTFSRKTVAIALASATAFGSINIVAPQSSEFAAPTAQAAEAERDVTKNVTADGLYYIQDGDGFKAGEKVKGNALPQANIDKSAEHRFTLNVGGESGLTAGDKFGISIAPVKNPALPDRNSAVVKFVPGQNGDILSGETKVGEWSTSSGQGVSVKMTEGAGEILTETPVTFTVASENIAQSVTPEELESLNGNVDYTQNGVQYTVNSGKNSTPISTSGFTIAYSYYAIPDYTNRNTSYFGRLKLDARGDAASIKSSLTVRAARANESRDWIELTVKPRLGDSDYYNAPYADYTLIHPNELLDPDNMVFEASEKDPEGKVRSKKVDIPEGMDYSTRIDKDGNLVVRFENVPANISPTLYFKNALVYDYVTPEVFAPQIMRSDNLRTEPYGPFNSIGSRLAITGSDVDNPDPTLRERKGAMRVSVNGSEAPQDDPQPIGGTTQTFNISLFNEGNTTLSAPTVTFPDGKTKQFKDVVLSPKGVAGDSATLTVDYAVPKDTATLNWKVAYPKVDPISFTNYITAADDSAANSIKYKEVKAPRGTTTTVKPTGVPKGAQPARTEGTPDWAQVGPDGTLTLKPDNSAALGRTEIPVKFTFSDGSETTVNPVVNVSEFDGSIDGDKDFDPRTQDEKTDEAIIDGLEDLNDKTQKQNEELKRQTDELKKQGDTLNKQAETLGKIQTELDKSNTLAKKQNELIGKQTDAINKQTDAIDKQTAAVEKQTAEVSKRLDKANKIAEDQLKTMNKELEESIKQTREMIRQSKALEHQNKILIDQHKDQLAQWEKENKFAQNEQDDRRHKANFERCVTSDPATGVLVALPILSLAAAAGVPYIGHMLEDANSQLAGVNERLGQQANIPADLRNQIAAFNSQHGDMVRTGATAVAGISALIGLAVAINNLTNGCYAEADISVGREPQAPKTSSESVLSSKPWIQEDKKDAEAANQ